MDFIFNVLLSTYKLKALLCGWHPPGCQANKPQTECPHQTPPYQSSHCLNAWWICQCLPTSRCQDIKFGLRCRLPKQQCFVYPRLYGFQALFQQLYCRCFVLFGGLLLFSVFLTVRDFTSKSASSTVKTYAISS